MRKKISGLKFIVALMVLTTVAYFGYRLYRDNKTSRIIEQTLNGEHWTQRMKEFTSEPDTTEEMIFLGNSITEGFDLSVFKRADLLNRGISGDFTSGVLKRLPEITARKPKKIFLMIGINDIIEKVPLDDICSNYEQIIQRIREATPRTKLYIQSTLPVIFGRSSERTNDHSRQFTESWVTSGASVNTIVKEYNERLKQLGEKHGLTYIDLHSHFLKDEALDKELTYDGVHLATNGYVLWRQQVAKYVEE